MSAFPPHWRNASTACWRLTPVAEINNWILASASPGAFSVCVAGRGAAWVFNGGGADAGGGDGPVGSPSTDERRCSA